MMAEKGADMVELQRAALMITFVRLQQAQQQAKNRPAIDTFRYGGPQGAVSYCVSGDCALLVYATLLP